VGRRQQLWRRRWTRGWKKEWIGPGAQKTKMMTDKCEGVGKKIGGGGGGGIEIERGLFIFGDCW
jgi:hypothetical protein